MPVTQVLLPYGSVTDCLLARHLAFPFHGLLACFKFLHNAFVGDHVWHVYETADKTLNEDLSFEEGHTR